jgi:hypothetical protein
MEAYPSVQEQSRPRDAVGLWNKDNLTRHGEEIRASGDRLSQKAIYARYLLRRGPSPALIKDNFGTLYDYYEHLGLAGNIEKWEDEDYIDWYRQLVGAGIKEVWSALDIAHLSSRLLGPSVDMLIDNFGSLVTFRDTALSRPLGHAEIMLSKVKHRVHEMKVTYGDEHKSLVYSENLQMLSIDGQRPEVLPVKANAMLALLFQNAGSPIFPEDFYEKTGQEDASSLVEAWQELRKSPVLEPFLMEYKPHHKAVYGMVFNDDERQLFVSRLAYMDVYPSADEDSNRFLNKRTAIAAGIGVASLAGAAIIGYRHHRK